MARIFPKQIAAADIHCMDEIMDEGYQYWDDEPEVDQQAREGIEDQCLEETDGEP